MTKKAAYTDGLKAAYTNGLGSKNFYDRSIDYGGGGGFLKTFKKYR